MENGSSKQNDIEQDCPPMNSKKGKLYCYFYGLGLKEKKSCISDKIQKSSVLVAVFVLTYHIN